MPADVSEICARAPVRVDPAGGGSDAPPYVIDYGGAVVNFGITRYAYATLSIDNKNRGITIQSSDYDQDIYSENLEGLKIDGQLDLIKAIVLRLMPGFGFKLRVTCEVQPGSGLGSSGAVCAACIAAFDRAMGNDRSPKEIALLGNSVERDDLGMAGGSQDTLGAALGGINHLVYAKGGSVSCFRPKVTDEIIAELERRCILVYTGESHVSGNIHDDIKISYHRPESSTLKAMQNLERLANEMAPVLEKGNIEKFGEMLSENWVYHQQLHYSCNNATLDRFYNALNKHTVGGKTCGAGGGGTILLVAKQGHRHKIKNVVKELGGEVYPLRIDRYGVMSWENG